MSDKVPKRRCIIQKLDFENCIVTNYKTTARGRKKLRARITREIEHVCDPTQEKSSLGETSPQTQRSSSPVLIRKQSKKSESPVFLKKKKLNFPEENIKDNPHDDIKEIPSSPKSPVFKAFKKPKTEDYAIEEFNNPSGGMTSYDILHSPENSSSSFQGSFQIEEFTQESNPSIKISSVESTSVKNESILKPKTAPINSLPECSPMEMSNLFDSEEELESPKLERKNYNKNSLLSRLHRLQQKQASEKLLWQHQNRKNLSGSLKVLVISYWQNEFNYFLKCQSLLSELELTLLIVDSRWVPNVKKVTQGSVIHLHPPWQKLSVKEPMMTVLLNVICLDVLDESREPVLPKETFQSLPVAQFEANPKLFIDSLFSSGGSGFF